MVFGGGRGCASYIQSISTADPATPRGERQPVVSWDPRAATVAMSPRRLSPLSPRLCRAALSRRVRGVAVRMRALEASQRPPLHRPRASQPPRIQNVYSACPRRARAADAEGEPEAGRARDCGPGRRGRGPGRAGPVSTDTEAAPELRASRNAPRLRSRSASPRLPAGQGQAQGQAGGGPGRGHALTSVSLSP